MTARVAAIDCGTNSIRLLVADLAPARRTLTDVDRRLEIVRLGQGVDKTGRLAPEALRRTLGALREYARIIRAARVGGGPGHDGDPAGTGEVAAISVNIGCVRMTERHLHADPPAREQVAAAISDIDAALYVAGAKIGVAQARSLLGLAGSITTVAAIAL